MSAKLLRLIRTRKLQLKTSSKGIPGDVGIGVSAPSSLLHIAGTTDPELRIQATGSGSGDDAKLLIQTTNGTFTVQNDRSLGTSGALTFARNTSNNLVIDHDTGNVGIGLNNPNEQLVVSGNASVTNSLQITTNTTAPSASSFLFRPASNQIAIGTDSNERLRIMTHLVGCWWALQLLVLQELWVYSLSPNRAAELSLLHRASIISNRSTDNLVRLNLPDPKGGSVGSNTVVTDNAELGGIYFGAPMELI